MAALLVVAPTHADSFDFGFGLSFIEDEERGGFDGGWDLQIGYEFLESEKWSYGTQLQLQRGWNDKNSITYEDELAFSSTALYMTARPKEWWLYFKGGIVDADYQTLNNSQHITGVGFGTGIAMGNDEVRLHLLDVQHFILGGYSFNMYTISIGVLL